MKYSLKHLLIAILSICSYTAGYASLPKDTLGRFTQKVDVPLSRNISRPYILKNGLQDRHIALWQSHGLYFNRQLNRWQWQRARIFQTVEDLYTQSYVLPFLVPMLENAGANVLLPRERDWNTHELIIDNNKGNNGVYTEQNGSIVWNAGQEKGFSYICPDSCKDFRNPFAGGTYRQVTTIRNGAESTAEWVPDFPSEEPYAVYVSYKSLPESTKDALYTVYHKGIATSFKINQAIGGGTWIYLGTFSFDKGRNESNKIVLSNRSSSKGKVVTADAVKLGGGIGISGYPRFCEGARYWMQWAGVPDSIYSPTKGIDDYRDDYVSRGHWVNYLRDAQHIPIDMSFAFHTDAGTYKTDSIIGTLGIYNNEKEYYNGKYENGSSRGLAEVLCHNVQDQIVNDIRKVYEPGWTCRGLWNKPYSEATWPKVPAMLLELLSHQNFADMRYGLDPGFRFFVSRSIYKGILKFLSSQYKTRYIVQPLPPDHLSLEFLEGNTVRLSWRTVNDSLEATASPEQFVVYSRIGDRDFDNGRLIKKGKTSLELTIPTGKICSFKVTAVNKGGESFPSEILSIGKAIHEKGRALIVNGFDRISGPADFKAPAPSDTLYAGFLDEEDHGVPYLRDFSYIGSMKEFRRNKPWTNDDSPGFGDSYGDYETKVIAGNTFDYPSVHGAALLNNGWSFASCSNEAVEDSMVMLAPYVVVDWIAGKQRQTRTANSRILPIQFKTFTASAQKAITNYCLQGGNFFASGAYIGSDLFDNSIATPLKADKEFAENTLKYFLRDRKAARRGSVYEIESPYTNLSTEFHYFNELNDSSYVVESPDAIEPSCKEAHTIFRYTENRLSAGIYYHGSRYNTCVLGFPFESIRTPETRNSLMKEILRLLMKKDKATE